MNEEKAEKVKRFFEKNLKHSKGIYAGTSFILQDWQYNKIIKPLYGTLNPDSTRHYRTCLIEVGKKNGKTTLVAALTLYHLFYDGEIGGGATEEEFKETIEEAQIEMKYFKNRKKIGREYKRRLEKLTASKEPKTFREPKKKRDKDLTL